MKPFIFPSSIETARALILHLVKLMVDEPERVFHIAFSGGNTPALMYDLWANEYKDITPWERMRVYFVDERCVPAENSESNYGMMRSLLLSIVPISYKDVFAIDGSHSPECEARRYSDLVVQQLSLCEGVPVFDIVLLGAGSDGHTSSIFPGQEELLSSIYPFEATLNPNNGQKRIAMTGLPMLHARKVIFLITGRSKADVVEQICHSGDTGAAAYIAHHASDVELFLDCWAADKIGPF